MQHCPFQQKKHLETTQMSIRLMKYDEAGVGGVLSTNFYGNTLRFTKWEKLALGQCVFLRIDISLKEHSKIFMFSYMKD